MQEVLNGDKAIKVTIKSQESLPNLVVVARNFVLNFLIKLLDAVVHDVALLSLVVRVLAAHLDSVPVLVTQVLLVQDVQVGEEYFLELVE